MHQAQGIAADLAAAVSGVGAAASWIATANDLLQLVATGIAIVAGVYAVRWHKFRLDQGRRHLDKKLREKRIKETIKETEPDDEESK